MHRCGHCLQLHRLVQRRIHVHIIDGLLRANFTNLHATCQPFYQICSNERTEIASTWKPCSEKISAYQGFIAALRQNTLPPVLRVRCKTLTANVSSQGCAELSVFFGAPAPFVGGNQSMLLNASSVLTRLI